MWKMSLKLSATTIIRRDIMSSDVFKKMQETSVGLGNLYASDWN